jgi:hypothetical protein
MISKAISTHHNISVITYFFSNNAHQLLTTRDFKDERQRNKHTYRGHGHEHGDIELNCKTQQKLLNTKHTERNPVHRGRAALQICTTASRKIESHY